MVIYLDPLATRYLWEARASEEAGHMELESSLLIAQILAHPW